MPVPMVSTVEMFHCTCIIGHRKERKRIEKLEMERDRAIKETKTTKEQVKERINKENILEERMKVLQKDMKEKIKTIKYVMIQ